MGDMADRMRDEHIDFLECDNHALATELGELTEYTDRLADAVIILLVETEDREDQYFSAVHRLCQAALADWGAYRADMIGLTRKHSDDRI